MLALSSMVPFAIFTSANAVDYTLAHDVLYHMRVRMAAQTVTMAWS